MKKFLLFLSFVGTFGLTFFLFREKTRSKSVKSPFISHRIGKTQKEKSYYAAFLETKPQLFSIIAISILSFLGNDFLQDYSHFFRASLINFPKTEFNGTVAPVAQVPNWTELTDSERRMSYSQIPKSKLIPLPDYNISDFVSGMNWSSSSDKQRNAYITYPVPNLGNYKLDGTENSGSHPGLDIKIPIGTPIRAIANGVVYKTGNQPTGFGQFISIAHVSIPDPQNPGQETTLVSNYAHLSNISVREGEKITKGQIIGKSGDSGLATAPHLHFQIDREGAPFHPYWPFSWHDVTSAGMNSYFDAVKQGLGKANAIKYTVHPMNFVTKFESYDRGANLMASVIEPVVIPPVVDQASKVETPLISSEAPREEFKSSAPLPVDPSQVEMAQTSTTTVKQTTRVGQFEMQIETDRNFIPGEDEIIKIYVNKAELVATAGIELSSTINHRTIITPPTLSREDFKDGVAEVIVKTTSEYPFKLIATSDFGEVKSQSLRPEIFKDVPGSHLYGDAIKFLKENNVVSGYSDGTFKPDNQLNRAEALKIILTANNTPIEEGRTNFPDVSTSDWFNNYVGTAVSEGIVKGYGDGKFKPANTVTRAEFLKMAILTAGFTPSEGSLGSQNPYPDVKKDRWYAKYFLFCRSNQLLRMKKGGFIVPNNPISRAEAADVLYRLDRMKR